VAIEEPSVFEDYYETLQLSPRADQDTIDRVYRLLVKRYHPDNSETGDPHKFAEVVEAHRTLSDPDLRRVYDLHRSVQQRSNAAVFEPSESDSFDSDLRTFETILSLLYTARRRDPAAGGLGVMQMERMLDRPAQHLEFHLWYLRAKGWIERLENGLLAITANGVDRVMHLENVGLRRDRMIAAHSTVDRASIKEHAHR
jgi:curved DNA-binding protein CbpA